MGQVILLGLAALTMAALFLVGLWDLIISPIKRTKFQRELDAFNQLRKAKGLGSVMVSKREDLAKMWRETFDEKGDLTLAAEKQRRQRLGSDRVHQQLEQAAQNPKSTIEE